MTTTKEAVRIIFGGEAAENEHVVEHYDRIRSERDKYVSDSILHKHGLKYGQEYSDGYTIELAYIDHNSATIGDERIFLMKMVEGGVNTKIVYPSEFKALDKPFIEGPDTRKVRKDKPIEFKVKN